MRQVWKLLALPGAHPYKGVRGESNPYLLVHSQACSNRYTTNTVGNDEYRMSNDEGIPNDQMTNAARAHSVSSFELRHSFVIGYFVIRHFKVARPGLEPGTPR